MKRFSKIKTKRGFTLLETLLATCILVIVSSMLMEGFITAMGYSYNSSVYARSAAYNSKLCVEQLSKWSMNADNIDHYNASGDKVSLSAAYYNVGEEALTQTNNLQTDKLKQITFGSLGTVRVVTYTKTGVAPGVSDLGSSFNKETIANDNAVADNRMIFFYYPTVNGTATTQTYFGNTHVYRKNNNTYVWGYDNPAAANGVTELGTRSKQKNIDEG